MLKEEINNEVKLTRKELQNIEGFEDLSDKQTEDIIDFIYDFSDILYNHLIINK